MKTAEQTNRSLRILAIVTTIFLPTTWSPEFSA
jgi:Mg2+ and Co2+ transporter CorA